MIDAVMAVLIGLLVFWVMGLGPALALTRGSRRWEFAFAVAGPVGLALTALAGTVLVRMDLPVERWAWPWTLAMGLASMAGTVVIARSSPRSREAILPGDSGPAAPLDWGFLLTLLGATALAFVLADAPIAIGGIQYTAMRYHRFDAFNYLEIARYLNTQPLSWILHAPRQAVVDRDALYLGAQGFMTTRYTTSILMAWAAKLNGVPVARVEYTSGIIYLLLAIGPSLALGAMAGLRPWSNGLLGLAISVGFWGICILDARFESQVNSIPIMGLIAAAAVRLEEMGPMGRSRRGWPAAALLSLAVASLVPLYPEILTLAIPGLGLFAFFRAWQTRNWREAPAIIAMAVLAGLVLGCASWPNFPRYMMGQAAFAAGSPHTFVLETFRWLFAGPWRDFFTGPWGLAIFLRPWTTQFPGITVLGIVISLAAVAITAVYLWSVVQGLRKGNVAAAAVHALALTAIAMFVFFLARGGKWIAGRSLGYGYMFLFLGLAFALPILAGPASSVAGFRRPGRRIAAGLVVAWLIAQGLLVPAYRINLAHKGAEADNYLILTERNNTNLGYYMRAVDYNTRPFERALDKDPRATLGIALNNAWYSDYFALALGDHHPIFDYCGIRDRNLDDYKRVILARQSGEVPPQFLLVAQHSPLLRLVERAQPVAENHDFVLLRRDGPRWGTGAAVLATSLGAQADSHGRQRFRLGKQPLQITLVNWGTHPISLELQGDIEPVNPPSDSSPAQVAIEVDQPLGVVVVGPATRWKLWVPLKFVPGIQTITLSISGPPPQKEYWLNNVRLTPVGPN